MESKQTPSPEKDNSAVVEAAAKDESVLTDEGKGTSSLTKGAAQELPHAWMSGLTAEQKADADLVKSLSKFEKGIPDLARSYAELEKKQGQAVAIPNEKATPEERARYLKAIGVPDKPEDYKLEDVKLPKTVVPDEVMVKAFMEVAKKNDLTTAQAQAIYGWYMPAFAKQLAEAGRLVKLTSEQAEAKLREELGADFDAAQTYKERAFRQFFDEEAAGLFVKSGLGNSPSILKGFIKLGKSISEHAFADGSRGAAMETGTFGQRTDEELANALYKKGN